MFNLPQITDRENLFIMYDLSGRASLVVYGSDIYHNAGLYHHVILCLSISGVLIHNSYFSSVAEVQHKEETSSWFPILLILLLWQ